MKNMKTLKICDNVFVITNTDNFTFYYYYLLKYSQ